MITFALALLEHPVLFTITLLAGLGFVGMTYEFLLRLFGKKTIADEVQSKLENTDEDGIKIVEQEQKVEHEPSCGCTNDNKVETTYTDEDFPDEICNDKKDALVGDEQLFNDNKFEEDDKKNEENK